MVFVAEEQLNKEGIKMKVKLFLIISIVLSSLVFGQFNGGSGSGYSSGSSNAVLLTALLQGPFSSGSMSTTLNTNNFIPLTQPYNAAPWNYSGTEMVASIPSGVVDWVLVELRKGTASSSTVQKRACFILSNGKIVDLDGISPVSFYDASDNSYYIVIRHRNHLAVMSANSLSLSSSLSGNYLTGIDSVYNFSTAQTQAFGTNAMSSLTGGVFGLIAGDGNANGGVNIADRNLVWRVQNGTIGYLSGDFDLNSGVNIADRNLRWRINNGRLTQVPN